jgi:hypothetical protein
LSEPAAVSAPAAAPLRLVARAGPPLGLIFGACGLLATIAVGLLHLDRMPFSLCYLKLITGLPCPTCGSTRALGRLFALDAPGAFAMNPLAAFAVALLVAWAAADLALLPRGRALGIEVKPRLGSVLRAAAVVAITANWAYLILAGR